jgi:NAD(P)-dependent dehydrogenase (short-subunit alcohol dehydrogenase family)
MARRADRLERAVEEAGEGAVAITCDVTDPVSCESAISSAAEALGGIDSVVYTPAIGPLVRLEDTDVDTWRRTFDTNVLGASLITAAALQHLKESSGTAVYLSSVSASQTPPWPGLGAYAVTKAALDKLVQAWSNEHPEVGFTRVTVGECAGGPEESMTEFAAGWDLELAAEMVPLWVERKYMTGALMDVDQLVAVIDQIVRSDPSVHIPVVTVGPRLVVPEEFPTEESVAESLKEP